MSIKDVEGEKYEPEYAPDDKGIYQSYGLVTIKGVDHRACKSHGAWKFQDDAGMRCTLKPNHKGDHYDMVFDRSWPKTERP